MPSWDMGYRVEQPYTFGYYHEFNPLYAKFLFTYAGVDFPDMSKGTACELGFGQGVSIIINAITSDVQWYGTDFNPGQVKNAQALVAEGNIQALLSDDSFKQFAQRTDLPKFDLIALHGIWSWINHENQECIVDFIPSHLKIGGVLYIPYNTSPGFIFFEQIRHLMYQYNKTHIAASVNVGQRFMLIRNFLEQLLKVEPMTIALHPGLKDTILICDESGSTLY